MSSPNGKYSLRVSENGSWDWEVLSPRGDVVTKINMPLSRAERLVYTLNNPGLDLTEVGEVLDSFKKVGRA